MNLSYWQCCPLLTLLSYCTVLNTPGYAFSCVRGGWTSCHRFHRGRASRLCESACASSECTGAWLRSCSMDTWISSWSLWSHLLQRGKRGKTLSDGVKDKWEFTRVSFQNWMQTGWQMSLHVGPILQYYSCLNFLFRPHKRTIYIVTRMKQWS